MKSIIKIINSFYDKSISFAVTHIAARKELGDIIRKSGKNQNCAKIDEWKKKWCVLGRVNKDYYRVFSQYSGEDINIVPDDICHNIIEPILNPKRFLNAYEDKCLFDKMLWTSFHKNITPYTYIKNIGGANYDIDYVPISSVDFIIKSIPLNVNKLIIKKSIDSSSGRGVAFVQRNDNGDFIDVASKELFNEDYLKKYFGQNYVVQKAMTQSPFMSQFCKTSVNTVRIAVYRSIKTNTPHIINTIIRIGKDGSLVDNAHAGGMFVGVNNDGILGKYVCNQYGEKETIFNNVNFSIGEFKIPNYEKIKEFAERVASALPHQRLLALDVMLDEDNNPVLLEYNIRAFSVWLFQFTNGSGFGGFTDEIIEYCVKHKKEATRVSVIF